MISKITNYFIIFLDKDDHPTERPPTVGGVGGPGPGGAVPGHHGDNS